MSLIIPGWFKRSDCIRDALEKVGAGVTQKTPVAWTLTLGNSSALQTTARLEQEFLLLDVDLKTKMSPESMMPESIWDFLYFNAANPIGVKFAIGGKAQAIRLRAEIPLANEQGDVVAKIREAALGMHAAVQLYQGGADSPRIVSPGGGVMGIDLPAFLGETGWQFSKRADGVVVKLDVPDEFYQASIGECQGRGIVVRVKLEAGNGWPKECRTALGLLLLSATGCLKMVRASAERVDDSQTDVRLEVVLPVLLGPADINHGLSALSVACCRWGREVRALGDQKIAGTYLWTRGYASGSKPHAVKFVPISG